MLRKSLLKLLLILIISTIVSFSIQRYFDIDLSSLKEFVLSYGALSPLAYSVILFLGLSVPFNPIPDFLVVNIAALVFPPAVAVLGTFLGHFLALCANYWLARSFGDDVLRKVLNENEFKYIEKLSRKIHLSWIFGLRFLLPLTAIGIDAVSYAAGIAKLEFGKFLLVSLTPWTFYSIIFFFSTNFLRNINPVLFFLPALFILGVPTIILLVHKKQTLWDKIKGLFGG